MTWVGMCAISGSGHCLSLVAAVAVCLLASPGNGLPDGAPADSDVCTRLQPRHGSHRPQQGPAPFRLSVQRADAPHQWLVTLSGERPFRGVLLQARHATGGDTSPLGRFTASADTHLIDCDGRPQVGGRT